MLGRKEENSSTPKITWIKHGDFTKRNPWDAPRHEVAYVNTAAESIIKKIEINGYDDGNKGFDIYADENEDRESFFKEKFQSLRPYFPDIMIFDNYVETQDTTDTAALAQAVKVINEVCELGEEITREIKLILGIIIPIPHEDIIALAKKDDFDGALKLAMEANKNDPDALWILADFYYKKDYYDEAEKIYRAIEIDNPHYQQANEQMIYIIDARLCAHQEGALELANEEIKEYQEQQLKFALTAGPHCQLQVDRIFHQVSGGGNLGLTFEIRGLQIDADSFVILAKEMRELRNKVRSLEMQMLEMQLSHQKLEDQPRMTDLLDGIGVFGDDLKENKKEKGKEKEKESTLTK